MRIALLLFAFAFSFGLTLEEALQKAVEKSPELSAKRHALMSKKELLRSEKQLFLPELFASYRFSMQSEGQSINIPGFMGLAPISFESSKRSYQTFQAGLRQTLFDGGLRSSAVEVAEALVKVAQEELNEGLLDVKLKTATAYLDALSAKALVEVYEKQLSAVSSDLRLREAFFKEGLVAITDVLQARVRLSEVQRDLRQAQGNYRIALENLSRLTDLPPQELKDLREPKVEPKEVELESLLQTALEKRPLLRLARERVRLSRAQTKAELSAYYPKVFLEATYNYSDQNSAISPKGFFSLGVGFVVSFQSFRPYYRALAKVQEERQYLQELKDLERMVELEVKSAYERYLTAKENLRVAEESLKFAEEFYRLSLEQYKNQLISGTDLLQAEASLTQARKARVISYYELLKAYYELLRAVGEL